MELEQFLERDMMEFLDEKAEKIHSMKTPGLAREEELEAFNLVRDYAKETRTALGEGSFAKACTVFRELLGEYNTFSAGSSGQRKAYDILLEVYEQLVEYANASPEINDIDVVLAGEGVKMPPKPYKIGSYEQKREDQIQELKKQKALKDMLSTEIRKNLSTIGDLLRKNDTHSAMALYQEIQESFQRIPSKFSSEKEDLLDRIMACYYEIKKRADSSRPQGAQGRQPAKQEEKQEEEKTQGMDELMAGMEQAKTLVRDKKPRQALEKYKELKHIFGNIQAPQEAKEEVFRDILALYQSIRKLEESMVEKKQRPVQVEPLIKEYVPPGVMEEVRRSKLNLYRYLDSGRLKSAIAEYGKLKELFPQVQDEDEQNRLYRELVEIHDRIEDMERTPLDSVFKNGLDELQSLLDEGRTGEAKHLYLELQQQVMRVKDKEEQEKIQKHLDSVWRGLQIADSQKKMRSEA